MFFSLSLDLKNAPVSGETGEKRPLLFHVSNIQIPSSSFLPIAELPAVQSQSCRHASGVFEDLSDLLMLPVCPFSTFFFFLDTLDSCPLLWSHRCWSQVLRLYFKKNSGCSSCYSCLVLELLDLHLCRSLKEQFDILER